MGNCNLLRRILVHHRDVIHHDLASPQSSLCGPMADKLAEIVRSQRSRVAKSGFLTIEDMMRTAATIRDEGNMVSLKNISDLVAKFFVQCLRRCGDPNDFIREAAFEAIRCVAEYGDTYKILEILRGLREYMPSSQIKLTICHILDIVSVRGLISADWQRRRQYYEARIAFLLLLTEISRATAR